MDILPPPPLFFDDAAAAAAGAADNDAMENERIARDLMIQNQAVQQMNKNANKVNNDYTITNYNGNKTAFKLNDAMDQNSDEYKKLSAEYDEYKKWEIEDNDSLSLFFILGGPELINRSNGNISDAHKMTQILWTLYLNKYSKNRDIDDNESTLIYYLIYKILKEENYLDFESNPQFNRKPFQRVSLGHLLKRRANTNENDTVNNGIKKLKRDHLIFYDQKIVDFHFKYGRAFNIGNESKFIIPMRYMIFDGCVYFKDVFAITKQKDAVENSKDFSSGCVISFNHAICHFFFDQKRGDYNRAVLSLNNSLFSEAFKNQTSFPVENLTIGIRKKGVVNAQLMTNDDDSDNTKHMSAFREITGYFKNNNMWDVKYYPSKTYMNFPQSKHIILEPRDEFAEYYENYSKIREMHNHLDGEELLEKLKSSITIKLNSFTFNP